ncbi:amidohydrolase [Kitasatospora cheerisanensis KCTC 2395]|uniref:Amidohydrolase n=1 Tax=Kitasatospora cheerisanensis KCTC 2395 TaxID=1348663 RepID=A0A066Z0Q7_9ACTN|nr:amidohydrolase [Kitasatospora cheerisanensis KCTC 2395]
MTERTDRTVLLRGGNVYSPADPFATAMLVEGEHIAWVGSDGAAEAYADVADEIVELDGALVTPAFVDAHVHATSTGLALTGLDLTDSASLADALAAVTAFTAAGPTEGILLGHGWDQTRWPEHRAPSLAELDAAAGGAALYLSRTDVHSGLATSALRALVPALADRAGYSADGPLTQDAHHAVRRAALAHLTPAQRRDAQHATLRRAAELGIGALHECAGPDISSAEDLAALLALAAETEGPEVFGYWGELGAQGVETAKRLGAVGAGGDLFVDGALGSHTACLHDPYADTDHTGVAYLTADQIAEHVVACTEAGLQAGFHAIGDAAIGAVLDGVRAAADKLGAEPVKAMRHRVEHAEALTPETIAAFAELGLTASVQPAFDAAWADPTACTSNASVPNAPRSSTRSPRCCGPASRWPSAPTRPSPRSTRGAPSAPPPSTAPPSTASRSAPRSPPTPAAATAPSATTRTASWCPARSPPTRSGPPPTWSSRPPTPASPTGPPTPAPAPPACPTSPPANPSPPACAPWSAAGPSTPTGTRRTAPASEVPFGGRRTR